MVAGGQPALASEGARGYQRGCRGVRERRNRLGDRHEEDPGTAGTVVSSLPRHHDDPFDRMLVAKASLESLTLVTADRRLAAYGGRALVI